MLGLGLAQSITITDFDTYEYLEGVGNSVNVSIVDVLDAGMVFDGNWELQGVSFSNSANMFKIPYLPVDGTIESSVTETTQHINLKNDFSKLQQTLTNWWESFKNIWR